MRRLAVAAVSALLAAMVMCTPVSADGGMVEFEDPEFDIGPDSSYNLPTDTNDQPTTSSPICQATYFDIVGGWVTEVEGESFSLGMEVAGAVDEDMVLPEGATGALWVWYFYEDIEYYADVMVVVSWDGAEFEAYLKYRTEMGAVPYPYWDLEFLPSGEVLQLEISSGDEEMFGIMCGMTAWFVETKVWRSPLIEPWEDWALTPNYGGWFPVDINDWDPAVSTLPWLPMP